MPPSPERKAFQLQTDGQICLLLEFHDIWRCCYISTDTLCGNLIRDYPCFVFFLFVLVFCILGEKQSNVAENAPSWYGNHRHQLSSQERKKKETLWTVCLCVVGCSSVCLQMYKQMRRQKHLNCYRKSPWREERHIKYLCPPLVRRWLLNKRK